MIKNKKEECLLMLSGGRDSFLSACELIGQGYFVYMIGYNNGHMTNTENISELANRIRTRFGEECTKYLGVYSVAQNINPLLKKALYTDISVLAKDYPNLQSYQLNCLACHTAMYLHSIAYCKAHNIKFISEGARESQGFFVSKNVMKNEYEELCRYYNLELLLPVYTLQSDIDRKRELAEWGFLPKTYEPQCWLGCPVLNELSIEQTQSLLSFYQNEIKPLTIGIIDNLEIKKLYQ